MLWKSVGTDMFTINNNHYLCILDYHSKFPVIKQAERLRTDSLIETLNIMFSECMMPSKIVLDIGTNFTQGKFENFCSCLSLHYVVLLASYSCQSNGPKEACIRCVKKTIKICYETNADIKISLLQV